MFDSWNKLYFMNVSIKMNDYSFSIWSIDYDEEKKYKTLINTFNKTSFLTASSLTQDYSVLWLAGFGPINIDRKGSKNHSFNHEEYNTCWIWNWRIISICNPPIWSDT